MKIKFLNGEYAGEIREFDEPEISIGREDGNSIQLLTGGVSRYHAQIVKKEDGSYFISDLNSTNGVKIDGVPIANDRVLCPGDEITIGEQKLLIAELSGVPKIFFKAFSDNSETLMDTRIDEPQPAAQLNTGSKNASAPTENKAKNDTQLSADKLLAELKSVSGNLFNSGADRKNGSSTAA